MAILQMIPKDGDLRELANWRPIAILYIFYKLFSKFIYLLISSYLFHYQSSDLHGFTLGKRIEDVLVCAEVAIEHHQEFNLELWLISLDMRKAFDTIDHKVMVRVPRSRGFLEEYLSLISMLYGIQRASVNRSSEFLVQRGVKQGNILSAVIFNCVLDIAFDELRLSLNKEGLFIAYGLPRLINTRCADDILLYANSLNELTSISERLMDALQKIGFTLNMKKTKMLRCNPSDEESTINFTEIGRDFVKILGDDDSHSHRECHRSACSTSQCSNCKRIDKSSSGDYRNSKSNWRIERRTSGIHFESWTVCSWRTLRRSGHWRLWIKE